MYYRLSWLPYIICFARRKKKKKDQEKEKKKKTLKHMGKKKHKTNKPKNLSFKVGWLFRKLSGA